MAQDLDAVFTQHFSIIRAKCARVLGDTEEAADVAQETFVRLCESGVVHEPAPARLKWIYVTGTRLAIDRLRRRRLGVEVDAGEEGTAGYAGSWPAADDALGARQSLARLGAVLSPQELEVVVFSRCDRMTQDEIAATVDLSARQVRRILARVDQKLGELRGGEVGAPARGSNLDIGDRE